jgi:hypothetical protein
MVTQIIGELFALGALCIPLAWEVQNDKDGDDHKSKWDLVFRAALAITSASFAAHFINRPFTAGLALAVAIHFLFFDYWVADRLEKNGVIAPGSTWFTYLGKSSPFDRWQPWRNAGPWGRLTVRFSLFIIALFFYFDPLTLFK